MADNREELLVIRSDKEMMICSVCKAELPISTVDKRMSKPHIIHYLPDRLGVVMGVPSSGRITGETFASIVRDLKTGTVGNFLMARSPYISKNRNNIVIAFKEHHQESEYLFMCDDDIWWDEDVIPRMVMHLKDHPVVVADVALSESPTSGYWEDEGHNWRPKWPPPSDRPYEVDGFGTAFFGCRREVFDKISDNWFSLITDDRNIQIGEDISFSLRLREAGYKPLLIPGLSIVHWRVMPIMTPLAMNKGR